MIREYLIGKSKVLIGEMAREALKFDTNRIGRADQNRIIAILEWFGWKRLKKDWSGHSMGPSMSCTKSSVVRHSLNETNDLALTTDDHGRLLHRGIIRGIGVLWKMVRGHPCHPWSVGAAGNREPA